MRSNNKKILAALAVAGVVAASGSAFTATNTVDGGNMGQGVGEITGYVTNAVSYRYDNDGTTVTGVSFNLDKGAESVKARLLDGTDNPAAYADCVADTDTDGPSTTDGEGLVTGGDADAEVANQWHCDGVSDVLVSALSGLDVFATNI